MWHHNIMKQYKLVPVPKMEGQGARIKLQVQQQDEVIEYEASKQNKRLFLHNSWYKVCRPKTNIMYHMH